MHGKCTVVVSLCRKVILFTYIDSFPNTGARYSLVAITGTRPEPSYDLRKQLPFGCAVSVLVIQKQKCLQTEKYSQFIICFTRSRRNCVHFSIRPSHTGEKTLLNDSVLHLFPLIINYVQHDNKMSQFCLSQLSAFFFYLVFVPVLVLCHLTSQV